jgi:aminopeptidase N
MAFATVAASSAVGVQVLRASLRPLRALPRSAFATRVPPTTHAHLRRARLFSRPARLGTAAPAAAAPTMTAAAKSAENAAPKTILLSDYKRPPFLVDSVHLTFQLDDAGVATTVCAKLRVRRAAETAADADLVLDGELLELRSVSIDGTALAADAYATDESTLTVKAAALPGGAFVFESEVAICPVKNKALEGLYMSSGNFCTQCEAEGFRRITYFPDRPDVMSKYTVRVEANKAKFPVLLSNGNVIETGPAKDATRHYAVYEDPWPKPSYLFALVAGEFAHLEDTFKTMGGKDVTLRIYVKGEGEVARCEHAMASLKNAMRWDEETYGLEYDLGIFNIVAVSDFSMGAMENKSLNIFNTTCVLASRETSTDGEFNRVEGVVAHEYFQYVCIFEPSGEESGDRPRLC